MAKVTLILCSLKQSSIHRVGSRISPTGLSEWYVSRRQSLTLAHREDGEPVAHLQWYHSSRSTNSIRGFFASVDTGIIHPRFGLGLQRATLEPCESGAFCPKARITSLHASITYSAFCFPRILRAIPRFTMFTAVSLTTDVAQSSELVPHRPACVFR
jgi:hypothetical protein